jgi:hypothetical protein
VRAALAAHALIGFPFHRVTGKPEFDNQNRDTASRDCLGGRVNFTKFRSCISSPSRSTIARKPNAISLPGDAIASGMQAPSRVQATAHIGVC